MRPGVPSDTVPLAAAYQRSWQAAYRGLVPDAILDRLRLPDFERRRARSLGYARRRGTAVWVVTVGERVGGFIEAGPCRDPDGGEDGEVYALYLDPAVRGRGLGRPLVEHAVRWLRSRGFTHVRLWVLHGNHRAERFYRHAGWRDDGARERFRIAGYPVVERRMRRPLAPVRRYSTGSKR